MAEGGVGLGVNLLKRLYNKAKNYKGDIQSSNARLKELKDTLNDSRKHLYQFSSEYSESSAADWEEYLHKGERVLRKETAKLKKDRERGRTRFALRPGSRERRSRSNSRVREEIARIGRRESRHKKQADSRERRGRSSQREATLPDPDYYGQADRNYVGNHYQRSQSRATSIPSQTHQIRHRHVEAWLDEQHNAPTTETCNDCCKGRHDHARRIQEPSRAIPPNLAVVHRTHRAYPGLIGRGNVEPREEIARRDPYHEHPRQEAWRMKTNRAQNDAVIARERITVYTHDSRGHGRMIETVERVSRIPRREIHEMPERFGRLW
ncbi:hypothetical protein FHL15_000490 [Xylaria flabelliformis]|uniref:Uncharacterized protein n=1 Tax=Xylaria flabelliformis TaxID=2512241 RepID=A0A553IDY7_9PEZI|nr:hypothetical protein FHL15_000490 [Xylaria flabelliformis]